MMMVKDELKKGLREAIRRKVRAIEAAEREVLSVKLRELLRVRLEWRRASSILLYSPLSDEPDIALVMDDALAAGKKVHLPRYNAATGTYAASCVASRADLINGHFGIREPAAHCAAIPLNQLDFLLVPGIAFDLTGRRLGRGKGYYDRLLAEVRGHKCGVCFDAQVVPAVPEEPHDIRLDSILTPTRWHSCQPAA